MGVCVKIKYSTLNMRTYVHIKLKVWRRTERGLQMEEESVVFSNIEVRVKRAGPSGLGDPEVTEYIVHIRSWPFERENGASVHLATTEGRFMPN